MRTKSAKQRKVHVITMGCSKNLFDSEVMMGQLKANQFDVTHNAQHSDERTVIINTCGFIDSAKEESINTILEFAGAKQEGIVDKVYVTGCLSERYKDDLIKEMPEVDAFFGTRDLGKLLKTLKADYKKELVGERLLTTPSHYAYFKIAEGCDRPCSFCAIPLMRGKHNSTPMEELVKSATGLVQNGVKELILIAQDLTYYGLDIYQQRRLPDLLRSLSDIDGLEWIRLQYAYPSGFPMEILDVMQERDNVCNYLDMPLQHISDNMLKSMRRGITKDKTIALIDQIRNKVPDISLRTTLISGYPGETQDDFEQMYDWVEQTRFDRLGLFPYSHEENTHAFQLKDDVPDEVKHDRIDQIMELQSGISLELNQAKVGREFKVLIDRMEGNDYIGRTAGDSPEVDNEVIIPSEGHSLSPGQFVQVRVTSAENYDLIGQVVS